LSVAERDVNGFSSALGAVVTASKNASGPLISCRGVACESSAAVPLCCPVLSVVAQKVAAVACAGVGL
jgi:hypothetical protein